MTFRANDKEEAQALDINQLLNRSAAAGVIEGGDYRPGAGSHEIAFDVISVYLDESEHQLQAQSVDLSDYIPEEHPKKCIVYVDTDGEYQVADGTAERLQPNDRDNDNWRWESYRPAPPSMADIVGVPVVEVFLDDGSDVTTKEDFRDRRLDATASFKEIETDTIRADTIIDGEDVKHSDELADKSDIRSDADINQVTHDDPDHAEQANHNYFSGIHGDLEDQRDDNSWRFAHHVPPNEDDFRNAVSGNLQVDDLMGQSGSSGEALFSDGEETYFGSLPQAESPLINEGTIVHTTGGSTTEVIEGLTQDRGSMIVMAFATDTTNSEPPTGDTDWTSSWERQWDAANGNVDVEVNFGWANGNDPGEDVNINWAAYELMPATVTEKWNGTKTVNAIAGSAVSPDSVSASSRLQGPTYDDLDNYPDPAIGSMAVATGNGPNSFGQYLYNGASWSGPFSAGVSALSDLTIDTAKDWNDNTIINLADPVGGKNATNKRYVDGAVRASSQEHSKQRRVVTISHGSGGKQYHRLAEITSPGAYGLVEAQMMFARQGYDIGDTPNLHRELTVSTSPSGMTTQHHAMGTKSSSNDHHLSVRKDGEDIYLYAETNNGPRTKIIMESGDDFGQFDFIRDEDNPPGNEVFSTREDENESYHIGDLRANRVFDNGDRVITQKYTDQEARNAVLDHSFTVNIPRTTLEAGETVEAWVDYTDNDASEGPMKVHRLEVQNEGGDHPQGLYMDIINGETDTQLAQERYNKISTHEDPFLEITEGGRIVYRIRNNTGSTQDVSGLMGYSIQP